MSKLRAGQVAAPSKITFEEVAAEYVAGLEAMVAAGDRAPRTLERYKQHLDVHVLPGIGHFQVQKLTADALAAFLRDRQSVGLSSWTRKGMLTPISRVLSLAVRRGYASDNPLRLLQPEELPKGRAKDDPRFSIATRSDACLQRPTTCTARRLRLRSSPDCVQWNYSRCGGRASILRTASFVSAIN